MEFGKVCIAGMSPKTYRDAERFFGTDTEIWTLNQMYLLSREIEFHASKWFDPHTMAEILTYPGRFEWLQEKHSFPILMQQEFIGVKDAVVFPKDELIERFGRYFTSSVAWIMAYAIHTGYTEINLTGIDMNEMQYMRQRPGCEYFIGRARGMGITVNIPESSALCKGTLYGYGER